MIKKYKKKPIIIEALQWDNNDKEMIEFLKDKSFERELSTNGSLFIDTLEGVMEASNKDYIIKGINGEFYPCKPDIFEKTYEEV